jgi:hypothetical protein
MSGSKTFKKILAEFSYVSIIGDGNCLFRSLSYATTGNQNSHNNIRQRICDYLLRPNLPKNLRIALTGIDIPSYVAAMRSNAVYGTLIELLAFSHMERHPIIVYYTNEAGQYLSEVYNSHYRSPVIYLHLSNEHYSVLAPKANRKSRQSKQSKSKSKSTSKPKSSSNMNVAAPIPVSESKTEPVSVSKTEPKTESKTEPKTESASETNTTDLTDAILVKINEVLRLNNEIVQYYRKGVLPTGKSISELESLVESLTADLNTQSKNDLDISVNRTKGDEALARLFEEEDIISSEIDTIQKNYPSLKSDIDKTQYQERLDELNAELELVRAKIISLGGSTNIVLSGGSQMTASEKIEYLYRKSYAHYKNIYLDLSLVRDD